MKLNNQRPFRTIHVSYVPDEEIGGLTGFFPFIQTKEFKDLNVGLALDEGNRYKKGTTFSGLSFFLK